MDKLNEFKSRRGGVLIGIRCDIKCEHIDVPITTGIEQVIIKIIIKSINVLLFSVYNPPSVGRETYSQHCELDKKNYLK